MITYEQAVHFLEVVLRMPPTWKQLVESDPLEFLTVYLKRHAIRVPFQNLGMTAIEPSKRWFPSEAELATQGLTGTGGCCIHLNYFSMMLFRALGLDSFVVRGDHYQGLIVGNHCLVMVKLDGPKDFGTYMIEAGGYYPILEVVPMDSAKLPYRTKPAGGFPYEFREFAPGWIGKYHLGGGPMGGQYTEKDKVLLRTSWDLKPRGHWEFDYPMLETFTNPAVSSCIKVPMMYRFFSNAEFHRLFPELSGASKFNPTSLEVITGPTHNGKSSEDAEENEEESVEISEDLYEDLENPQHFVYVWKRKLVVGDGESRKIVNNYQTFQEMGPELKKYFPMIPAQTVDKALKAFSEFEVTPSLYDTIL